MHQITVVSGWPSVWASWREAFLSHHLQLRRADNITRPTVSWQPSAELCSRDGPHAVPDSCVCVLRFTRMPGVRLLLTHTNSQLFRNLSPLHKGPWFRHCSHLVRLKMRIWNSWIHSVGSQQCVGAGGRKVKWRQGAFYTMGLMLIGCGSDSAYSSVSRPPNRFSSRQSRRIIQQSSSETLENVSRLSSWTL